jgi:hypothetical protein
MSFSAESKIEFEIAGMFDWDIRDPLGNRSYNGGFARVAMSLWHRLFYPSYELWRYHIHGCLNGDLV